MNNTNNGLLDRNQPVIYEQPIYVPEGIPVQQTQSFQENNRIPPQQNFNNFGGYPVQGYPGSNQNPNLYPPGQGIYQQPVIGQAVILDTGLQGYRSDANGAAFPIICKCPFCGFVGPTIVDLQPGGATWGWCIIMALFTGCCCIPFCIDSCQDRYHYCQRCGAQVGVKIATMC